MSTTITTTNFSFPNQKSLYRGKVREVYNINDELLVMVATDRLSAFDVVLPKGIPYKGQILNQIATKFMELTKDIVRISQRFIELGKKNWSLASFPVEAHGFRETYSWIDEYSRILQLFESTIGKKETK